MSADSLDRLRQEVDEALLRRDEYRREMQRQDTGEPCIPVTAIELRALLDRLVRAEAAQDALHDLWTWIKWEHHLVPTPAHSDDETAAVLRASTAAVRLRGEPEGPGGG